MEKPKGDNQTSMREIKFRGKTSYLISDTLILRPLIVVFHNLISLISDYPV